jgi:hypothetical protein
MDATLHGQIQAYLSQLDALIQRGRELRDLVALHPADSSIAAAIRHWQNDCGIAINELSGGSKAHWLAKAFSEAFLIRSEGRTVEQAAPEQIVSRLLNVLEKGAASLSTLNDTKAVSGPEAPPHHFDFVHDPKLRPVLEQAYQASRSALENGAFSDSMLNSCGVLEAIVTDALEHKGLSALIQLGAPTGQISDWSFETRLAAAERAGLIRGGCARLPLVARGYREHPDHANHDAKDDAKEDARPVISERDARIAGQVLRVVMRDLDPGR